MKITPPKRVMKPAMQLVLDKLRLVSAARGRTREGTLLQAAMKSIKAGNIIAAVDELEHFLMLTPNLSAEHRAIVLAECRMLRCKSQTSVVWKAIGLMAMRLIPLKEMWKHIVEFWSRVTLNSVSKADSFVLLIGFTAIPQNI